MSTVQLIIFICLVITYIASQWCIISKLDTNLKDFLMNMLSNISFTIILIIAVSATNKLNSIEEKKIVGPQYEEVQFKVYKIK